MRYASNLAAGAALVGAASLSISGAQVLATSVPLDQATFLLQKVTDVPAAGHHESCVITLKNMVTEEDLNDEEMYAELLDDISEECAKFGKIMKVVVPKRPAGTVVKQPEEDRLRGVGSVFLHYEELSAAKLALSATVGRKFGGAVVEGSYFPEALFVEGMYSEEAAAAAPAVRVSAPTPDVNDDGDDMD